MDTAKAVSLHVRNEGDVLTLGYHDPRLLHGLPLVAVPTTAGTGAETNTYGVITDEAAGRKAYIGHPSVLPVASVLDPELTVGLPPAPTAATGVDALTHSLESLLSRNPNPFAEAIALAGDPDRVGVAVRLPLKTARTWRRGASCWSPPTSPVSARRAARASGAVHAIGHALGTRGEAAPWHGPRHGPAGGPRDVHGRPRARAGPRGRGAVGGEPAGPARRGGDGGHRGRRGAPRSGRPAADPGATRDRLRSSRRRSSPMPSTTPRSRTARGSRRPVRLRRSWRRFGAEPQRRMYPGRSGSLPCQRSYSSVWKRANRLMKWAPCSRKISTARFVWAAPRARTEMTNRPSRAAAS